MSSSPIPCWLRAAVAVLCLLTLPSTAQAELVYENLTFIDTNTGLRWKSTLSTIGRPGPVIPVDRLFEDGFRLATKGDVETLFAGNFPGLLPNAPRTPVTVDPSVVSLLQALGGSESITLADINGQSYQFASFAVSGWIAIQDFSIREIPRSLRWVYVPMQIGYGTEIQCDALECFDTYPVFGSSVPAGVNIDDVFARGYPELSAIDASERGYFLVSTSPVPLPSTAALLAAGLILLSVTVRRPR